MMRVVVHFGPMTVNFFFSPVFLRYDWKDINHICTCIYVVKWLS
jgi:hypothetical protein